MKIFESNCKGFIPIPDTNNFHEQWVAGTYIHTGIFPRFGDQITIDKIQDEIPALHSLIKQNRKKKILKGISASYIIPLYQASCFPAEVEEWIKARPQYKYAIWHEPVLFNDQTNEAIMNQNWGIFGLSFRDYLAQIICSYLSTISKEFSLNGNQIKMDPTRGLTLS